MRLSLLLVAETPWPELLELARHAAATGWDGLWYGDHLMPPAGDLDQPIHESWTILAALAASVPGIRLGHMVSGNTLRHPALVAKMAATIDHVSGGRFVLGLGAGWQKNEHDAYGVPYFSRAERLHRLDEACSIVKSLFTSERTTFAGQHYSLSGAPFAPKPVRGRLPLWIGTGGEKLGLAIVARHADGWNTGGVPERIARKQATLDTHCAAIGRDPKEIVRSAFAVIVFGEASADWYSAEPLDGQDWEMGVIAGGDDEIRAAMRSYRELGIDELVTSDLTFGATVAEKKAAMDRVRSLAAGAA
ncbi:MAG: TIGR03560 family F420-dependent LLM class oxidoreductase [Candidatus Binatia bacterium]